MPFAFMDFETQSLADLTVVGGLKYALDASTRALLLSWVVDEGSQVKLWCPDLSSELVPEVWAAVRARMAHIATCPPDLVALLTQPDGYLVAHNMNFDRNIWQQVAVADNNFPQIVVEQTLDSMCQFQSCNLPGPLDWAGRVLGLGNKTVGGKSVMLRFASRQQPLPGSPDDVADLMTKGYSRERAIATALEMWDLYMTYAVQDTALMRDVWNCTRKLDATEWSEYWTSERINDRGMLADLDVCAGAMAYREEEAAHVVEQIQTITQGAIAGPTFTAKINAWLYERLPDDMREFMVKATDEETGEATRLTGSKDVMTRLLEEIETSDAPPSDDVIDLIEVLQFGRASSAVKFEKIWNQAIVDDTLGKNRAVGRLTSSYVFNGAGQTGRFCLAEGSRVLVRHIGSVGGLIAEVPIEYVRLDDQVWDGHAWVWHGGVVRSGRKEVITYDGVTATPEHDVFVYATVGYEKMHLIEARDQRRFIVRSWSQPDAEIMDTARHNSTQWPDIRDEKETYDILDAGPNNRFTANDRLVSNSSRGVQVHNLPRSFLPDELDILDMVAARVPIAQLRDKGPIPAVLSKLIRPTFIAPEGKLLVWGDWAAIEARVNPWLADSREAEDAVLSAYRNGEDLYILNAEPIFNIPADVILERYMNGDPEAKGMRQASKIASLALGFLGSVGALRTMARGYGMRLSNEEAQKIVDGWRDRNKWARRFGDKAQTAAFNAMRQPGSTFKAGRLQYQYAPDLLGGTLACFLPDGRPIVYPLAKIVKQEKFGKEQDTITYLHGMGRRSLWNGLQIQGGTQATAASILRSTLNRLEDEETEAEIVLHTHDEVGGEVDEARAGAFAERLHSTMVRGFDWSEGLPLAAEVSTSWFYTKNA